MSNLVEILIQIILFIFVCLLIYDVYERFQPFYNTAKKIPGCTRFPIIGNIPDIVGLKPGEYTFFFLVNSTI